MKERLDKLLVDLKFIDTRSKAKNLIEKKLIEVDGKIITKAGEMVSVNSQIKILTDKIYVSRAAYKLLQALEYYKPNITNLVAADIGASTGGFTEVLLDNGVKKVFAIDVGHGQLDKKLLNDPRVVNLEGINIKFPYEIEEKVDFAVCDLSFISLKLVMKNIWQLIKPDGFLIALIKPQFEAGLERLGKDAVIRDEKLRLEIVSEVFDWLKENKYQVNSPIESPITGKDGNLEYLALIKSTLNN